MVDTGWDWFEAENEALTEDGTDHWQACFDSDAGAKVLADLERHFLQTALGPDASDKAIWMREGKRALVLQIKRLAERSAAD
ncbi:MAG: hypothetical protein CMO07_02140 [Thalassospira sp.]|uniref:Bbp19 family protein n=1 Tax=Thalassospira TaxID=168934 RepID=UPI0002871AEE|nr:MULTISPECIES: hypothetical protein [Thalassospira]EKF08352.1 hypothetical protein TH2_09544 [Thalassospira profundimaris WP0211]MBE69561.1 hypothetical protein [Thalassospira sp.]|tara:strand:- start:2270 stop:2515 length:246 start_codon:yes stop_codon:yes gene_type:complete